MAESNRFIITIDDSKISPSTSSSPCGTAHLRGSRAHTALCCTECSPFLNFTNIHKIFLIVNLVQFKITETAKPRQLNYLGFNVKRSTRRRSLQTNAAFQMKYAIMNINFRLSCGMPEFR